MSSAALNGFEVIRVNSATNRRSVLTQCMTGVDCVNESSSTEHSQMWRTCFTATVAVLHHGEALRLQDTSIVDNHVSIYINRNETNYFGIVQLRTIVGRR